MPQKEKDSISTPSRGRGLCRQIAPAVFGESWREQVRGRNAVCSACTGGVEPRTRPVVTKSVSTPVGGGAGLRVAPTCL